MDSTGGVIRRVMNKPRDIIPRNPAINPDVNQYHSSSNHQALFIFHCRHYWMCQNLTSFTMMRMFYMLKLLVDIRFDTN